MLTVWQLPALERARWANLKGKSNGIACIHYAGDISVIFQKNMIEVEELCKYFENTLAVDRVSFRVRQGETLVLLGTSGSGKTTTLKMINRLIEPSSGTIKVNGKNILAQNPEDLRRQIGYVIQSIGLFPHYTVWQNIGLVPQLLHWSEKKIIDRSRELLSMVGLPEDMADRYPAALSGGQQQRVGLARALAADPPVILLDEPFGALDPITKRQIQAEFDQLDTLRSKTMVMVTHDVFEAITLADTIGLMDAGKMQQIGTPKELIFSPASDFVRRFFDTQRFRLELQVITLMDVIEMALPPDPQQSPSTEAMVSLPAQSSLLEALEEMEKADARYVMPQHKENKNRLDYPISRERLMDAFYKIKSKLKQ